MPRNSSSDASVASFVALPLHESLLPSRCTTLSVAICVCGIMPPFHCSSWYNDWSQHHRLSRLHFCQGYLYLPLVEVAFGNCYLVCTVDEVFRRFTLPLCLFSLFLYRMVDLRLTWKHFAWIHQERPSSQISLAQGHFHRDFLAWSLSLRDPQFLSY